MKIGVLALQGDVREHVRTLRAVGAEPVEVRRAEDLTGLTGIVLPGGESTTIGRLASWYGLLDPLAAAIDDGLAAYGTCAGMILLAKAVTAGEQPQMGVLDVVVERNAFGRQNDSFELDLDIAGLDRPFRAVFIRAPWVTEAGEGVEVLAAVEGRPVMVRQGRVLASSFHPELTGDDRLHRMLVDLAAAGAG